MVGESRNDLLQWLNTELGLEYTKVEQCGTGAAYCQLMDSIFGGIPMNKVKFDTRNEYDYRQNMKILQAAFNRQTITKPIEVERLIKCRLQDNLELLQFIRRIWMENKDVHGVYDAAQRRLSSSGSGGSGGGSGSRAGSRISSAGGGPSNGTSTNGTTNGPVRSRPVSRVASGSSVTPSSYGGGGGGSVPSGGSGPTSANTTPGVRPLPRQRRSTLDSDQSPHHTSLNPTTPNNRASASLQRSQELAEATKALEHANEELYEYRVSLESMKTERNFYFNKLIEIETLIRNVKAEENAATLDGLTVSELADQVQEILYTTEEGFQVAEEMEGIDEETF